MEKKMQRIAKNKPFINKTRKKEPNEHTSGKRTEYSGDRLREAQRIVRLNGATNFASDEPEHGGPNRHGKNSIRDLYQKRLSRGRAENQLPDLNKFLD